MADGDRLIGALHRPGLESPGKPIAILIHGLTGCEDSIHVRVTAHHLLRHGYPVVRLNLRGSAPARPTCRGQYHAGKSEDIAAVFEQIDEPAGIVALGYSLGGNVLLKHLGEAGMAARLRGAVAISVPLDLCAASRTMRRPRNRLYHDYILNRMKEEATAAGAELSEDERRTIEGAKSVYQFDDRFIAPRNGFDSANHYYRQCSSREFIDGIAIPTLIVHALDDPWISPNAYLEGDWSRTPNVRLLLSRHGGHVGFHGSGDTVPWHDRCAEAFFGSL